MTDGGGFIVKICGVTSPEDAALAAQAGADAIGVNLWPGSKELLDHLGSCGEVGIPSRVAEIPGSCPQRLQQSGWRQKNVNEPEPRAG